MAESGGGDHNREEIAGGDAVALPDRAGIAPEGSGQGLTRKIDEGVVI
jgi:hypothetical protein